MKKIFCILCLAILYLQKFDYVDLNKFKSENIQVEIKGEVNKPNTYTLPYEAKVKDLIQKANGLTKEGDTSTLNLNQPLHNDDVIVVSKKEGSKKVSLNSASIEELSTLSGIGPSTAQKIIEYRNNKGSFKTIEDIMLIKGIKEKLFAKIKDFICL